MYRFGPCCIFACMVSVYLGVCWKADLCLLFPGWIGQWCVIPDVSSPRETQLSLERKIVQWWEPSHRCLETWVLLFLSLQRGAGLCSLHLWHDELDLAVCHVSSDSVSPKFRVWIFQLHSWVVCAWSVVLLCTQNGAVSYLAPACIAGRRAPWAFPLVCTWCKRGEEWVWCPFSSVSRDHVPTGPVVTTPGNGK